jgi:hypothetical protein
MKTSVGNDLAPLCGGRCRDVSVQRQSSVVTEKRSPLGTVGTVVFVVDDTLLSASDVVLGVALLDEVELADTLG